jgi:hypothetical protein
LFFYPTATRDRTQTQEEFKSFRADLQTRDNWMRAVLADADLSFVTRMIACYLATFVIDEFPSADWDGKHRERIESIAAAIGLPKRVVIDAMNILHNRRYIAVSWIGYDLLPPPSLNEGDAS